MKRLLLPTCPASLARHWMSIAIIVAAIVFAGCGDTPPLLSDLPVADAGDIAALDTLSDDQGTITGDAREDAAQPDSAGQDVHESDTVTDVAGDTAFDNNATEDDGTPDATVEDSNDGDSADDQGGQSIECQPDPSTPVIRVTVYRDLKDTTVTPANNQSKTDYIQTFNQHDEPWAGIPVSLLAPATGSGETCDEGFYYFGPDSGETFTDGPRVLSIDLPDCRVTTHNWARRTPKALASGKFKMVVMGDSIAVLGTTAGTFFFDNLANYLDGFGDITIKNVALSGSTTTQWTPTTTNFKKKVAPELADTDVVFVTLGGNDIMHYVSNNQNLGLAALMDGITAKISEVETNLSLIFSAIREANPDTDIVWLIYPNYAMSDKWRSVTGTYADLVEQYFTEQMYGIVNWAAAIDGLILVDLFSRMDRTNLNASLFDELHYNAYGHQILGDELFKVLGGVVVGDGVPATGAERQIGVNCE